MGLSQQKEVTGRLHKLENTVGVLNDRVVDQEKKIYALNSKNKREKRQTKSLPQCTKLPCAFDFPRNASITIQSQMNTNSEASSLPKSCSDLSKLGHSVNGIYPVQGGDLNSNKITLVFCQFSSPTAFEKGIIIKRNIQLKRILLLFLFLCRYSDSG